jgi:hypothetical protein
MSGETSRARGRSRELDVKHWFEDQGWVAYRLAWGNADVLAMRLDDAGVPVVWLVQVKSTGNGPYDHFRPRERQALLDEATRCGAVAMLAFWPPYGALQLIDENQWPKRARMEALSL